MAKSKGRGKEIQETVWLEIKADYLKGIVPKKLAEKYNILAKTITEKASKENWVDEKTRIFNNLQFDVEDYIKKLSKKALKQLEEVIDDSQAEYKDKVSASRAILDVSGLKSSKQEITGKDGAPLSVQKEYILPEEVKDFEAHYKKAMEN